MTLTPARFALAIDGASATLSIGRGNHRGALFDQGLDEAHLHLDLVLAVEQLVVDGLLVLQHLLDSSDRAAGTVYGCHWMNAISFGIQCSSNCLDTPRLPLSTSPKKVVSAPATAVPSTRSSGNPDVRF
jgi:hypothetical protein